MGYQEIDGTIEEWARLHRLPLYKEAKEAEARYFELADQNGRMYQIWIDEPDYNGLIGVHVWNLKRRGRRRDFLVSANDLSEYLENVLKIAQSWIGMGPDGNISTKS